MGCRVVSFIIFGLLLHSSSDCKPLAQFFPGELFGGVLNPFSGALNQAGSIAKANSEAFSHDVGLGNLAGINAAGTRSGSITQDNGSTSIAKSGSLSEGINIGKLGISNTVSSKRTYSTDEGFSGSLQQDLNVGDVGIGGRLSSDIKDISIGLQRNEDGGVSLGFGLLKLNLGRNKQNTAGAKAETNSNAYATGYDATADSQSDESSDTKNFGPLAISSSKSRSESEASSENGEIGASAEGQANAAHSKVQTRNAGLFGLGRLRRSFENNEFRFRHQQGRRGGEFRGIGTRRRQEFEQQSAGNTQTQHEITGKGNFRNNAGLSQSSILASDGSSGQFGGGINANSETANGIN